jgi:aerobic C4-dicarboxylate transport protein
VIPSIPVGGLALILGIDRFMSEARALTNLVGNGVATVVVSRWENELDMVRMAQVLNNEADLEAEVSGFVLETEPAAAE